MLETVYSLCLFNFIAAFFFLSVKALRSNCVAYIYLEVKRLDDVRTISLAVVASGNLLSTITLSFI